MAWPCLSVMAWSCLFDVLVLITSILITHMMSCRCKNDPSDCPALFISFSSAKDPTYAIRCPGKQVPETYTHIHSLHCSLPAETYTHIHSLRCSLPAKVSHTQQHALGNCQWSHAQGHTHTFTYDIILSTLGSGIRNKMLQRTRTLQLNHAIIMPSRNLHEGQ
jgi:hypothetical protein